MERIRGHISCNSGSFCSKQRWRMPYWPSRLLWCRFTHRATRLALPGHKSVSHIIEHHVFLFWKVFLFLFFTETKRFLCLPKDRKLILFLFFTETKRFLFSQKDRELSFPLFSPKDRNLTYGHDPSTKSHSLPLRT